MSTVETIALLLVVVVSLTIEAFVWHRHQDRKSKSPPGSTSLLGLADPSPSEEPAAPESHDQKGSPAAGS